MSEDPAAYFSRTAARYAEEQTIGAMPDSYIRLLDRFIELLEGDRVLDAGCGHGRDVRYLHDAGLDVAGIDAAEQMIEQARERMDGTYRVMDVRDLAFEDGSFDGIWCNTVMQFLPPDGMETAVEEFGRVIADDGVLYITFKLGDGIVHRDDASSAVSRHLIPEDQAWTLLAEAGFDRIEAGTTELNGMTVLNAVCRWSG